MKMTIDLKQAIEKQGSEYRRGFMLKCAEAGINPEQLLKSAQTTGILEGLGRLVSPAVAGVAKRLGHAGQNYAERLGVLNLSNRSGNEDLLLNELFKKHHGTDLPSRQLVNFNAAPGADKATMAFPGMESKELSLDDLPAFIRKQLSGPEGGTISRQIMANPEAIAAGLRKTELDPAYRTLGKATAGVGAAGALGTYAMSGGDNQPKGRYNVGGQRSMYY